MKDQISVARVKLLHPAIRTLVIAGVNMAETALGKDTCVRLVQTMRTFAEQNALYAIGRTLKGANSRPGHIMGDTVTNARGGQSIHNFGLAFDAAILYDKDKNGTFESLSWDLLKDFDRDGLADHKEMVNAFKYQGFAWGGDWKSFKDNPHFERTFGKTYKDLLALHNAGKVYKGTDFPIL